MEQKFIKFEDAIEKLGISAEKLAALRERGQLRAYRDGPSWKFRGDEIQKMMEEGIPEPPPPSDIGLVDPEELIESSPLELEDDQELQLADEEKTPSDTGSSVAEDSELELGDTDALSTGSELELDELEDAAVAESSDLSLDTPEEPSDPSDSILLSEEELGESVNAPASTIIGKSELASAEADLDLASDDVTAEESDVKVASPGVSDVLSSNISGSGVLDDLKEESDSAGVSAFEDLEELEIDLAAESSRILAPDELAQAQARAAAEASVESKGDSDLTLDNDPQETDDDSNMGSTDVPMLELEASESLADEGSGSEIELSGDEDLVLSDAEGSDITLDSGDSGINLAPADSGLALEDIPLEMGGSAILSSLSMGDESSDPEISLIASDSKVSEEPLAELQTDEDFQLTPLSEGAAEEEGDSSSQVIALDADMEDLDAGDAGILDEAILTEDAGDDVILSEDYGDQPADDLGVGTYAAAGAGVAAEAPYSLLNILSLGSCALLLMLASIMMLDMVRNIWSWNETYTLNSSMLDALLGMFGLN